MVIDDDGGLGVMFGVVKTTMTVILIVYGRSGNCCDERGEAEATVIDSVARMKTL